LCCRDYSINRTDSFEEFLFALLKLPGSKDQQFEVRDIIENPEEQPSQEAVTERLKSELEEKCERIVKLEMDVQRAQNEYQNCRNSVQTELAKQKMIANAELLKSLMPVFDEMQTALESKRSENFSNSIELVVGNLFKVLGKNGFSRIDVGSDFDVSTCEAIADVVGGEDGKIAQVVQNGYILNGVILRHAKVTVYVKK